MKKLSLFFIVTAIAFFTTSAFSQSSDTTLYQMKNTGFGITDIDHNGHKEIIMFDDNTGLVRVYENTGNDSYTFIKEWTTADWTGDAAAFATAQGTKARIACGDFDMDGVDELYIADRHGQMWVVTPNGNITTMFDAVNFHLLHDWKTHMNYNESGEQRGCIIGDMDRDNKPDVYIAGNNFGSIMDMEWDGGVGGDVTDPDNYSFYDFPVDQDVVAGGHFARPSGASIGDMDNDGHQEIVAIVPWTGDNPVPNLRGLYVFENDLTVAAPSGDNTDFGLAWHEASDDVFVRGYVLTAGIDVDQDGKGEILTYDGDGGERKVYLFEADGDNNYTEVWSHQFSDGTAGIVGGERGCMVADLDNDGRQEITVIMDSYAPGAQEPDTLHYQMKNTGFGITDIDHDGHKEIIMFDDNTGLVRVYENTGNDSYTFIKEWTTADWTGDAAPFATAQGTKARIACGDFDMDGVDELYLADRHGQMWVITPNGNVTTMFDAANFHLLHDWKTHMNYNESGEQRGCIIGDMDRDNKPDVYIAGNNFGSIMDMEWDGGVGGDVTDPDNYSFYDFPIDEDVVAGGHFARPSGASIGDMDNDGHQEIVAIVPWTGDNPVPNLRGLYVFENDLTVAAPSGDNTDFGLAWHEASDDVFVRGYVLTAGIDVDQDGKGEILTYDGDGGERKVYLFEADGDNNYTEVWSHQFSDGTAGIVGGERGCMVADLDNDGRQEITVIMDSYHPDSTALNGFNAGHIFEWDGTDNGLPSSPTLTFDPPRDNVGQVRLEYNTTITQMDNDANLEIVMTHRGGHGMWLSIMELENSDLSGASWNVEFTESFPPSDTVHYQMKNTGFGITDIDRDGHKEIIMFDDNTGLVRVYENTGTDSYTFIKEWTTADWTGNATAFATAQGTKGRVTSGDFDMDGVDELYLADRHGQMWVVTPNGNVATMFDAANFHLLHDWKTHMTYNENGEQRGCILGDLDRDGKPDIYIAGNNFGSIMDMEWDGGVGGTVTDPDNYSFYNFPIDGDVVADGHFARPSNAWLADMDNDGHQEIVAIVPWTGDNPVANLRGLYVFEFEKTSAAPDGDNTNIGLAWHEASDEEFVRGYVLTAGVDVDNDGWGEILTYDGDGGERKVYLFEADGDNSYSEAWSYQFSDGTAGIIGGERGCVVADLDHDGRKEITVIMDSYSPDSTGLNGFNAGHIFETDGTNNGLPSVPTLTFDPPRDDVGQVRLEYNTTIRQMDNDGNPEIVMTHRGGHGMWLSIMELENSDLTNPIWNVEFRERFSLGISLEGFHAGHIFEWDGTDNGLPSSPTLTFDPPRDDVDQVRLEYNTTITQMDNDANLEIVMTHRGGHGMWLSIMELENFDLSSPSWNVEFKESFPPSDTVHYQMKNTGFGITDIDRDGHKEIIMFDDNTGLVRVYENTGTDSYTFIKEWTTADWTGNAAAFATAQGTKGRVTSGDFDMDGVDELYLADRHGQMWVVTPNGNVATMFDAANFHLLHDWKTHMTYNENGEQRGCILGDLDRDGKPDIYIAGNNFGSIMDMEWDGGVGGTVTDPDNYSFYNFPIDGDVVADGHFARPSNAWLADMDNDGHQEIVAIVPWTGDNPVPNLRGLYVFEFEKTSAAPDGDNTNIGLAWHEASDEEFVRGYVLTAGVDVDNDGWGEILTYDGDGGERKVYLFEADGDNSYSEAWSYQFSDGTAGIIGGERGCVVADLDHDGRKEITVIMDSYSPDSTGLNGFNAGHIFETDGTNNGLPSVPTLTFDPPRDDVGQVRLEYNTTIRQMDNDGNPEIVMTHRGGHGMWLSIMELENSDLTNPSWKVEFEERFVVTSILPEFSDNVPRVFSLKQNYPNPFNPVTVIAYDIPKAGQVKLEVINIMGQKVKTLVDKYQETGSYNVYWNATNYNGVPVANGIYFYRIKSGDFKMTKKMLLLK